MTAPTTPPDPADIDPADIAAASSEEAVPWAEARPPHLPDRLTAIPFLAWGFVALTILQVVLWWEAFRQLASVDQVQTPWYQLGFVPGIAATLLGAALFWRHPDAWRTLRGLAVGVGIIAVAEVMQASVAPLQTFFSELTPAPEAFPFLVPSGTAYGIFATVLSSFGLLYLAQGLRDARRREDVGSSRPLAVLLVIAIAVVTAILFVRFGDLPQDDSGTIGALVVVSLVVSSFGLLAWAYLTVTALDGRRARERPTRAWLAVVGAGTLVLAGAVVDTVTGLMAVGVIAVEPSPFVDALFHLAVVIQATVWLLMLAAFALGLSSTDEPVWEEVAPEDSGIAVDGDEAVEDVGDEVAPDADAVAPGEAVTVPTPGPPAVTTPGSAGS